MERSDFVRAPAGTGSRIDGAFLFRMGGTGGTFNVGSGATAAALTLPAEGSITGGFTQLAGSAPAGTTGVTYLWHRADTDSWTTVPASVDTVPLGSIRRSRKSPVSSGISVSLMRLIRR